MSRLLTSWVHLTIVSTFLAPAVNVFAAESSPEALEEVVVTSTRLQDVPVDPSRVPANVTIITEKEIKDSGARTIQEVLQYQPGVTIFDNVGNDFQQTISLRGFASDVNPTTVLVDGVRINRPDFNIADLDLVPFYDIERIEIVPGPSALFGKNALGGVINIVTRRGRKEPEATVEGAWGSFHRERYLGNTGGGLGKFDYYFSVGRETENGFRDQTAARITRLFGKFGFRPDDSTDLSMTLTHINDRLMQAGSLSEAQLTVNRRQNPTPGDFQDGELNKVTVDGRKRLSPNLSVALNGFYEHQDIDSLIVFSGGSSRVATDIFSGGGTLQMTHDATIGGRRNLFVTGGEFVRHDFEIVTASRVSGENVYAVFVQDSIDISPQLTATAAVRYDWDRLDFTDNANPSQSGFKTYTRVTPRAGLNYRITEGLFVYFSYSEGFRTPTQDELFALGGFGSNPNLKPIKSRNYEIGGKLRTGWVHGALALYQADVKDEIFLECANVFCFPATNKNFDKTRRRGIEASVKATPNKWVDAFANYTFTEARFRTSFTTFDAVSFGSQVVEVGDSIPMVPKNQFAVGVNTHPVEGATLSLNGLYVGTKFMFGDEGNNQKRLPGYFLLNARASYDWRVGRDLIGLFFQVNNLLDTKYETLGRFVGLPTPFFVPAPGISLFGGLSIRFQYL